MAKKPDTNLARGLNCLERHQSVKPQTTMALFGYSEIVGGSCGASSDNLANVQCVPYFLLTEREGPAYWENIARVRTRKTEGNILLVRSRASES